MSDNPAVSGNIKPRLSNKSFQPNQEVTKTGSPQRAIKEFTPPLRTSDRKTSDSPTKALPESSKEGKKSEDGKILPRSETASRTVDAVRTKDESVRRSSKTINNDSSSTRKTSPDRQGVKTNSDRPGDSSKFHIRPDKETKIARDGNSIKRSPKVNDNSSPLMKTPPDRQEVRKNSDQTGQRSEGRASSERRRSSAMLNLPTIPGKDNSDESLQDPLGNDLSASAIPSNLTNDFRRSLSRRPRDSIPFAKAELTKLRLSLQNIESASSDELILKEIRVKNSKKKTSSTANAKSKRIARMDQDNETTNTSSSADLPKLTTAFENGEVEGDQIQLDLEDLEVRHTKSIMRKPRDSIRLNRMNLEAFRKKPGDEEDSPSKRRKPRRNSTSSDQFDFRTHSNLKEIKDILQPVAERPHRMSIMSTTSNMSTISNISNTSGGHEEAHEVALPYISNTGITERKRGQQKLRRVKFAEEIEVDARIFGRHFPFPETVKNLNVTGILIKFSEDYFYPWWTQLWNIRRTLITIFIPIILIALPGAYKFNKASCCAYVALLMYLYWLTSAVPMCITSLLPITILPWVVHDDKKQAIVACFLDDRVFCVIGCLLFGSAIQRWKLHKRVALRFLIFFGVRPRWLIFIFMMINSVFCMFVGNIFMTPILMPVVGAVIDIHNNIRRSVMSYASATDEEMMESKKSFKGFRKAMKLAIAFSAQMAENCILGGSLANQMMLDKLDEAFFKKPHGVTYGVWAGIAMPLMAINLMLTFVLLVLIFKLPKTDAYAQGVKQDLKTEYEFLGPTSFPEYFLCLAFVALTLLNFFRKPIFMKGWGELLGDCPSSATAIIAMCIIMSAVPSDFKSEDPENEDGKADGETAELKRSGEQRKSTPVPAILDWRSLYTIPWSVVLLIGGTMALSKGFEITGLSDNIRTYLSARLTRLSVQSIPFFFIGMVALFTNLNSDVTSASLFLQLAFDVAKELQIKSLQPVHLAICVSIASSFGFILPVSCPSNAIAYVTGGFVMLDMIKVGSLVCLLCVLTLIVAYYAYIRECFG